MVLLFTVLFPDPGQCETENIILTRFDITIDRHWTTHKTRRPPAAIYHQPYYAGVCAGSTHLSIVYKKHKNTNMDCRNKFICRIDQLPITHPVWIWQRMALPGSYQWQGKPE